MNKEPLGILRTRTAVSVHPTSPTLHSRTHFARHGELAAADGLEVDLLSLIGQPSTLALALALNANRIKRAAAETPDEVGQASERYPTILRRDVLGNAAAVCGLGQRLNSKRQTTSNSHLPGG